MNTDAKSAAPLDGKPGVYELIDRLEAGPRVVLRDDEIEAADLLAAVEPSSKRARRFRLLDTGRFDVLDLERLLAAGVPLLTSDEAMAARGDFELLLKAAERGVAWIAELVQGEIADQAGSAAMGMDVHVSNRTKRRTPESLLPMAEAARQGRAFLVYYHHGPLEPALVAVAAAGAWIHLTDASLGPDLDAALRADFVTAARRGRLAVHVERGLPLDLAESLFESGAVLLFKTTPADYRSRFRPLERRAGRRTLPERAFYMQAEFLP